MHDDKNELLSKIESQKLQISFLEETLKNLGHSNILLSSAYCKLKSYGHSEDISDPDNAEKQSDSSLTYNLQVPYTIEFARKFAFTVGVVDKFTMIVPYFLRRNCA